MHTSKTINQLNNSIQLRHSYEAPVLQVRPSQNVPQPEGSLQRSVQPDIQP
jgi:hypothetical protein